jgi:hypothetical protein
MIEFNKKDVIIVAKAILEDPLRFMSGDFISYYFCNYCNAELHGYNAYEKNFKHDLDCPVLIAQDLLTTVYKGDNTCTE